MKLKIEKVPYFEVINRLMYDIMEIFLGNNFRHILHVIRKSLRHSIG